MPHIIDNFVYSFAQLYSSAKGHLYFLCTLLLVLWGIQLLNSLLQYRLNHLGILPRRAEGLLGIFISPFLHGSYTHLFLNSIPFFVLGALVLVAGKTVFLQISLLIIVISGCVVWIFGRPAYHIGASALILGYWGFLLCNAYIQRSFMAFFLALLCLYYFGSLIYSLFPQEERTSWEGHLAGFLSGVFASYFLAHYPHLL
jgi:membrane associated rhomboid family serine protease